MYSRCVTADVTDALSVYMYWASCLAVDVTDVVWQLNDVLFLDCLQGIRAVIAESYERIHRSNLVGMGIIPMQYQAGVTAGYPTHRQTAAQQLARASTGVQHQRRQPYGVSTCHVVNTWINHRSKTHTGIARTQTQERD